MTDNSCLQLISLLSSSQNYIAWKLVMYNKDLGPNIHHTIIISLTLMKLHMVSVIQYFGKTKTT
jgi:hypothetical protein